MLEHPTYWCDGHWTRFGVTVHGRVAGLDSVTYGARPGGYASAPESAGNGNLYLVVPDAESNPVGFADLWRAYAVPRLLPVAVQVGIGVLACAWLVAFVCLLRRRRLSVSSATLAQ
jgi:hypothetical protein